MVCRGQPSMAFTARAADLLKEKGVCLIVLSDAELQAIVALREQGDDPAIVVERLYRQRIARS
jgi:hypothetical protein